MMNVQEESVFQDENAAQINRAAHHIKKFLIWVLVSCIYNIGIYYFFFSEFSYYLSLALIPTLFVIACGWFGTKHLLNLPQIQSPYIDLCCQLLCLSLGITLAIFSYVILSYLALENEDIESFHLIALSLFPMSVLYIIGSTYLTQRFRYFLLIFIPSALPFIFAKLLYPHDFPPYFNPITKVWLLLIFIFAVLAFNIHRRLNQLDLKNHQLLNQSFSHSQHSNNLANQFNQQIEKYKEIEQELQRHNQLLQQKVQERASENRQITDRLNNHKANLSIAHETAGITSWLWNIEKRTLEMSAVKHSLDFECLSHDHPKVDSNIHPDDQEQYRRHLRLHLRGQTTRFEANYRVKKNKQWYWIQDIGEVVSRHPVTRKPLRMVGIVRDIQKEKEDQEQLKLAANVFNQVAEGIFVLDNNLCYLDVNTNYEKLTGFNRNQLLGKQLFDISNNHRLGARQQHRAISQKLTLSGEFDAEIEEEFIVGKKLSLWMHINAITDDKNKIIHYVGITTDLTDQKKQEQRLSYLENYDLLTDLPNRFYFHLKLHHFINSNLSSQHFAVVRINIDRFRLINEFLNHEAGDELLKLVAQRLRNSCHDAQLIAYLNNDDFAVIYNSPQRTASIHQQLQHILLMFQHPFEIAGQEQSISISIGVALYPEHGHQVDSLISHAELAVADAKRLGGNTIRFYNNETTSLFDDRILLKRDLQHAIKKNQLIVYYQAQICSITSNIIGFEALARWEHPTRGLISPEVFIPLAEETSLISEIGQFVIFESCKQIQVWRELGFDQINISVNIVAQQIHRGQLLIDLDTAMSMYKVLGKQISLELTESSLLDHTDYVIELLGQIKQRDISISLDDFGTGYSSLAYLSKYPIDTLKIDKAFIAKIGENKDSAIVDAIIAMGKAMGMLLIAEGVETRAQVDYLKIQQCDVLQGFYFSKPLTAPESTEYLRLYTPPLSSST